MANTKRKWEVGANYLPSVTSPFFSLFISSLGSFNQYFFSNLSVHFDIYEPPGYFEA